MPRPQRLAVLAAALLLLALVPAAAQARVLVIAASDGAQLTDIATNAVVARLPLGPARAAVAAPDGSTGFVAAGDRIAAVDLAGGATRAVIPAGGTLTDLAISTDGTRLYAARRGALLVVDPGSLAVRGAVGLGRATPRALAVSADGTLAAAVLDARHVGIVSLSSGRLVRRVAVRRPSGVAFAPSGTNVWVSSSGPRGGRLLRLGADGRLLARWGVGRRVGGGGLAWTRNGRYAFVGGDRGQTVTAVFDLRRQRVVARVPSGRGPGRPAVSEDGTRVYVADAGGTTVSVVSATTLRRIAVLRLDGGARPADVAPQPGLAVTRGTDAADNLIGTRGRDLLDGLGGDDRLSGGRERDTLLGGAGNDVL